MRVIFFGTSSFALPSLKKLIDAKYDVVLVVTQPDKPKGRGRKLVKTPVKELAESYNIPVFQPDRIKKPEAVSWVIAEDPDLVVVASYGQIIPVSILEYPRLGCLNVHASLLPKYRGAAPIQRALMAGEKVTGITIMLMDEGLDTGDIIMQTRININQDINHGQLEKLLADKGSDLLIDTISNMVSGSTPRKKQDTSRASYAKPITRDDELLNWRETARVIHNRIRALSPVPGAYTLINGIKVKIFKSQVINEDKCGDAGMVVNITENGFAVQTDKGILEILEVQKEGKKRMPAKDFIRGFDLEPGNFLGTREV